MRNYWALCGESNNTKLQSRVTYCPKIVWTYTLSGNVEICRVELLSEKILSLSQRLRVKSELGA
jgi:hypothetical protein